MKLRILIICCGILSIFIGSPAYATHIHYLDYADFSPADSLVLNVGNSYEYIFNLTTDAMLLSEVGTGIDLGVGSYDPNEDLHYVYLRIDPNNNGGHEDALKVEVNNIEVIDWSNPISIFDWGHPFSPLSDPYHIMSESYEITVNLTPFETIEVVNINLEGCFDSATPVPAPAAVLFLGSGLLGLAGFRRKFIS